MSHRRCCRRESRCGCGTGFGFGNSGIFIIVLLLLCGSGFTGGCGRRC